ncbi:protein CASC3-like isoform X1 [Centruroides vittatus]|uniref:protein CASC3-like isoform X1 n=1 Tax=Centruroides vittatus TaxID=120091 RepID=UPI00351013C0
MAERRRRRCARTTDDSEELSEGSENEQVNEKTSDAQESGGEKPGGDSEYESAEEEDGSDDDVKQTRKKNAVNTSEVLVEEDEDTCDAEVEGEFFEHEDDNEDEEEEDECVEGERQQGDGEESVTLQEKVLDDDEDRRNPQYIPKKGSFYEHDDRINSDTEIDTEKKDTKDKKKKKLWLDEGRWGHDMYHEDEQAPKSREELISIYGYDIRSEDGPPRARRRRRYGRGPTKYTRNWQDQTAYQKLRGMTRGRIANRGFNRGRVKNNYSEREENDTYPSDDNAALNEKKEDNSENTEPDIVINDSDFPALNNINEQPNEISITNTVVSSVEHVSNNHSNSWGEGENAGKVQSRTFENSKFLQKTKEEINESRQSNKENYKQSSSWRPPTNYRGQFKYQSRGRSRRRGGSYRGRGGSNNNSDTILTSEMEKLSLKDKDNQTARRDQKWIRKDKTDHGKPPINNCQQESYSSSTTGGGSDLSATRPKRYSSLRQRSVADPPVYQPTQTTLPPPYYDASYQAALYSATEALPPSSPHQTSTSPPIPPMLPTAPFQSYATASYQETYAMRPPVPSPPRMFPPVTLAPAPQPTIPTPYIAPSNGIVNYGPPPAGYPQYTFPQFATAPPPPSPVTTPPEVYRGGIMYYSMHTQQHATRTPPQKRPTAAIPIVPPPEREQTSLEKIEVNSPNSEELKEMVENSTEIETLSEETSQLSKPTVEVES